MYHVFKTGARGGDSGQLSRSPSNFASGRTGDRTSVSVLNQQVLHSVRDKGVGVNIIVYDCSQNFGAKPGTQYRLPILFAGVG